MVGATETQAAAWRGVIDRYRDCLLVGPSTPVVTLLEGNTPLVRAERLAAAVDARIEVYLKLESLNPTGSFKDRGMTLAMSKAVEGGRKRSSVPRPGTPRPPWLPSRRGPACGPSC